MDLSPGNRTTPVSAGAGEIFRVIGKPVGLFRAYAIRGMVRTRPGHANSAPDRRNSPRSGNHASTGAKRVFVPLNEAPYSAVSAITHSRTKPNPARSFSNSAYGYPTLT